jgi:Fe-S-cluster-containing dehydrogenase component/CRP-like cAMP-binding protein
MASSRTTLERPQRWDAAFDPKMTDVDVDRLLSIPPFSKMRPENFPPRLQLRDILKHDTSIRRYGKGEIIVRQGDYGNSAFLVISGKVRVVLRPGLSPSVLGRREPARRGLFRLMAQIWSGGKEPESFSPSELKGDKGVSERIDQGDEVKVFLQDVPRILNEQQTAVMGPGELFGEIAALSRISRTATIFADTEEAELLEIRWQGLRDVMRADQALREQVDKNYREFALRSALRQVPVFRRLSDDALQEVITRTELRTYGDYDWSGEYKRMVQAKDGGQRKLERAIAEEGDYPNGVILIRSGFVRVSQKFGNGHRTLNYLGAGQFYGLEEIAHNWRKPEAAVPLQYTLRVIGYAHVIIIPTTIMEKVVLPAIPKDRLPPLITPAEAEEVAPTPARDAAAKIGSDMLEFLTESRFFNGTKTMIIDLERCTRCDDCVRACATAHDNNPRFLRHGPTNGRIMIANACMHCVDPVCMIGCPTGAIHRGAFGGEVVINPATCIGCKACYSNCPYEAIRMVEIRDRNGEFLVDKDMNPILKATKCDLCVEQAGGPACQRACPHGALARLNLNELDVFADYLQR